MLDYAKSKSQPSESPLKAKSIYHGAVCRIPTLLRTARTQALVMGGRRWKERLAQHGIRRESQPGNCPGQPQHFPPSPPAVEFLESKLFYPQQTLGINHLVFMLQLKYRHCPPPQSCADHSEEDAQGGFGHHPALGRPGNAKGHRIHQPSPEDRTGASPLPSHTWHHWGCCSRTS